jgi:HPt (histidine-containing phosphotransfer) domain-containing protein
VRSFALQLPGKLHTMRLALDRRDFAELAALAHWLKGSAGTVGFDEFFGPAEALEKLAQAGDVAALMDSLQALRDIAARMVVPEDDAVVLAT